jgi:hypothetical protein
MVVKMFAITLNYILLPAGSMSSEFKTWKKEKMPGLAAQNAADKEKQKKAVDTLAARLYFVRRSYWAGLQEP